MHLTTHTSSRLKQLSAAVMLACLMPGGAYAATLGKLTVLSAIGQPLNAEIELLSVSPQEKQSLAVKLAAQQAFSQANVEYNPALAAMQFSIETRGAAQVVHITSAQGFNEPAVDVLLELSSASTPRAVREYSFLLDPPRPQGNLAQVKADPKPVPALADGKSDAKTDAKADAKTDVKTDAKADAKPESKSPDAKAAPKAAEKSESKSEDKKPAGKHAAKSGKTGGKPSEYKVKQGDSLSAIANRMRPAGVSLDQMLVALYRANPDAFIGDNMSRMKAGAVLNVPDAAAAGAVDRSEADSVVVAQAQDFQAYRQQLAGHVAKGAARKGGAAAQSAGGKITAKVQERATPAAEAKDKLQLSKAGAGDGMTSEDKIAADKAAREAESRIKELEKNVGDLQKLLEIKNQNLAELSLKKDKADAAPAAGKPATAATTAPATSAAPAAANDSAPAATPPAAEAKPAAAAPEAPAATPAPAADAAAAPSAPAADTPAPADGATPPATADATANPPAAEAATAKPKPALSPAVAKPDFFEGWRENPMLLPGGGLLAAVLLAWAAYRARLKRKANPDDPASVDGTPPTPGPTEPVMEEPVVAPIVTPVEPEAAPEPAPAVAEEETFVPPAEPVVEPVPEPVTETPPVADPLFATDETAAVAAAQAEAAEAAEQQATRDAEEAMKIDLSRMEAPEPQLAPAAAPALDMSKLDFDLELDQNPPPVDDSALDIDLAAELAAQPPARPYQAPAAAETAAPAAGQPAALPPAIEGLSLDLSDADSPVEAGSAAGSEAASEEAGAEAAEEEDDETSSFAKEINTKLDLAAAYQEIGDKDGARELLDEVVKAGNRRQVAKAQEMLEQLA